MSTTAELNISAYAGTHIIHDHTSGSLSPNAASADCTSQDSFPICQVSNTGAFRSIRIIVLNLVSRVASELNTPQTNEFERKT